MNISESTTRLNKPVFPRGAGSLEQGHECRKSRGNKTTTTAVGGEGGRGDGYQKSKN